MTTERCGNCRGRRVIIGLGCIEKDCPNCKGVGHVKVDTVDTSVVAPVVRVKRSRKPRQIDILPVQPVSTNGVNDGERAKA